MARLKRRSVSETGPRSAHIARLPYACFAQPEALAGAELELVAPGDGDPETYACVRAGGTIYALTATCAANALGLVDDAAYSFAGREAALVAFEPLAARLKTTPERAAAQLLDGAVEKIVKAVADAVRQHELGPEVPLVALGGAGAALVPLVAARLKRAVIHPEHPEILSSIGAAVSLVRAELVRNATSDGAAVELAREAEAACVASGAAPATVTVETAFDARENVLRAVATGAVALEVGAADREPAGEEARLHAAADALGLEPAALQLIAETGFYRIYSENGSGRVAAVDGLGAVALAEDARRVLAAKGPELVEQLLREVEAATRNLGVATLLPRVSLVYGSRILDLSDARRPEDVAAAAARSLEGEGGTAVAVVAR